MDRRYAFFVVVIVGIGIATALALVFANSIAGSRDTECAETPHPSTGVTSTVEAGRCIWLDPAGRPVQVTTLP